MTRKLLKSFSLMLFMLHGSSEVFAHTHSMGAGLNETRSSELTVASNENGFIADGNYYIRNAEAGTFFAGGNAWGTRLSLKSAGDLIQITKKSGSDGYIMKDMSLINASTGAQIGEPNGALTIFIDQTSPASGYKFHKLTMDEIKVINDKNSTSFYKDDKGEYVDVSKSDKAYYLISYVNHNNQTVYLTEGNIAESGHHEVDGKYFDGNIPTLASAVWEIFTRDQLVSDLYNNATEEYFMSATPFITNPDFSRNYNASANPNDNGWNVVKPISNIYGKNENFVAEAANIEFELNQTLTNIPNGKYGITANGVYEGVEAATGNPYLYVTAGDKAYKKEFKYSEGTTSIQDWSSKFQSDKSYMLDTIFVTIWDNTLTVGFAGDRTDVTSYFDNVQLIYYGKETDLSTLNRKLNTLKKSASNIKKNNKPMSAECKAAIEAALQLYPDTEDANELNDAIAQLSKAIDDANASIALYAELLSKKYLDEVNKLNAEAQEWYNKNITVAIVNEGLLVSEDQLAAGLKTARIINGKGGDVTEFTIVNPSFETGSTTGWTVDGILGSDTGVKNVESSPRYAMDPMDGVCLYNTWNQGSGTTIHQSLKGLPAGRYVLSALMASTNIEGDVRYLHLSAGNHTVSVPAVSDNESRKVELEFEILSDTDIEITAWATKEESATLDGTDKSWFKVDDFHLLYQTYTDLDEDIQTLRDLIARDENKPIGFKKNEFSTYANRNVIKAHNAAKNYLETNGAIDSVINNHHLTKYQINEYINALKDESQWIIQKGDTNCIYNPYFALVKPNFYTPLYGWDIVDNYIEDPIIGGMGATSATADPTWTKFVNNRKARNLNGEWNTFSTAAVFRFEENNDFCSSNSVYSYGNETGFEMPLEPGQAYTLAFQYGYRSETKPGSVIIEVINKRTGEVVNRTEDRICTPQICVSDTSKIPETKQIVFNTTKREGYSNSLSNFDNLETYKVVVRNADPDNYWSMVMSNLSLYSNGTNAEEPSDTIRVDIAEAATIDTANSKKTVMVDEDGNKYYVYESLDEEKGTVVSFCIPVNEMAKGQKYYVVVVLNPLAKNRPVHLQIGLQGIPSRLIDRPSAPETDKNGVMTVLGEYVYTGEKVETLVYEYTATENIQNPMIQLSTEASSENDYETSVALKDIYLLPTASATGIEMTRQTKVSAPEGIYTMQGVKVSSLKKGMNVVRMSDGSVKKVRL